MAKYVLGEATARKLRGLLAQGGESSLVKGGGSSLSLEGEKPAPYTIAYSESVGGYIIYLPDGDILTYGGSAVDPRADLEEAGGDYPSGWYQLGLGDGDVYLKLASAESETAGDSEEEADIAAEFVDEKDPEDKSGVYIHIATITRYEDTGEVRIDQLVRSAIVYATGGADKRLVVREEGEEDKVLARISASEDIILTPLEVVLSSKYDEEKHSFINVKKRVYVLASEVKEAEETVFVATPLSEEL